MNYIDTDRVDIHYELPLNEIIYDFFDALKSRTRGYASFDYELAGYQKSNLVKLDIMLNGEVVDALSFIIHADKAYPRARKMAEKLREKIPRQLFEVPIQACVGDGLLPVKRSKRCARMFWRNVMAATLAERRSCSRSRRKVRSACASWEPSRSRRKRL